MEKAMEQYDYDKYAEFYDFFELGGEPFSFGTNFFLDKIFKKNKLSSVLDISCGTGAQAIWLAKRGYKVNAVDLNKKMLKIAKKKSGKLGIHFQKGDMRSFKFKNFDSVISMHNSIGHLNPIDLKKMVKNVSQNLENEKCFIFDICNLDYFKSSNRIPKTEFLHTDIMIKKRRFTRFNQCSLNPGGILHTKHRAYITEKGKKDIELCWSWDMQLYSIKQLQDILLQESFSKIFFYDEHKQKIAEKNKTQAMNLFVVALR